MNEARTKVLASFMRLGVDKSVAETLSKRGLAFARKDAGDQFVRRKPLELLCNLVLPAIGAEQEQGRRAGGRLLTGCFFDEVVISNSAR